MLQITLNLEDKDVELLLTLSKKRKLSLTESTQQFFKASLISYRTFLVFNEELT